MDRGPSSGFPHQLIGFGRGQGDNKRPDTPNKKGVWTTFIDCFLKQSQLVQEQDLKRQVRSATRDSQIAPSQGNFSPVHNL